MYDEKIKKLIERFKQVKDDKDLTNKQISEISGVSLSWVNGLFDGVVEDPTLYETIGVASALGISPAEIDSILNPNQCKCYIGFCLNYEDSKLVTKEEF